MMNKILLFFAVLLLPQITFAQWASLGHNNLDANNQDLIVALDAVDENIVWAAAFNATDFIGTQKFLKTTDGGQTITTGEITTDSPDLASYSIFALDENTAWTCMGILPDQAEGNIYKTTDGGATWVKLFPENVNPLPGMIHFWDENEGFLLRGNGFTSGDDRIKIFHTYDGGTSWEEIEIPEMEFDENYGFYTNQGLFEVIGDKVWFGTRMGRVFISEDRGLTWTPSPVFEDNGYITSIAFKNENEGMAASIFTANGFSKVNEAWTTVDGGMTWTPIAVPMSPVLNSLQFVPDTENTYAFNGNGVSTSSGMGISTDGGENWTIKDGYFLNATEYLSPTVAFSGGRIQSDNRGGLYRFTSSFAVDHTDISTLAGNGREGYRLGDKENANFYNPKGILIDGDGSIYISDEFSGSIKKIGVDGEVSLVAGANNLVANDASLLNSPNDMIFDEDGNILVADVGADQIIKVTLDGIEPLVTVFAGTGETALIDGTLAEAAFNQPTSLAKDASGNIYVGENGAVRKITPDGMVTTLAGNGNIGYLDGQGMDALFDYIWGLDSDAAGNLYVADAFNHTIRKVTSDGTVTTIGGDGTAGYMDGENSLFSFPEDVVVDEEGNVFVADGTNSVIRKITPVGEVSTVAGFKYTDFQPGLDGPEAIDGEGNYATFSRLRGIAMRPNGDLLACTWGEDLIREIKFGFPSHPLVVIENTVDNNWGIGHINHIEPYQFSAVIQNTSDFAIDNINLNVRVSKNGLLKYIKTSDNITIPAGSFEELTIEEDFLPNSEGIYDVELRFSENNAVFYTAFDEIVVTDSILEYGDGLLYVGGNYSDFFPEFLGGHGVSFSIQNPDSLTAISSVFGVLDTVRMVKVNVFSIENGAVADTIYDTGFIDFDSFVADANFYATHYLPEAILLEPGEYLFTIENSAPTSFVIGFDNELTHNSWMQNFDNGEWQTTESIFGFSDLLTMIRPIFGISKNTVSTSAPIVNLPKVTVGPNPFTDQFTATLSTDASTTLTAEVLNMEGRTLQMFHLNPGESKIVKMDKWAKGMYLLKVNGKPFSYAMRLMKQ